MRKKPRKIETLFLVLVLVSAGVLSPTRRTASAPRKASEKETVVRGLARSSSTPTTTFTQTNLVSDVPGLASITDPNLVNPWGMTLGLNSGLWISDNGAGKATTYDGTGQPIPSTSPLVVTIPAPGGGNSAPTGVATNATEGFIISASGHSAPSRELITNEY